MTRLPYHDDRTHLRREILATADFAFPATSARRRPTSSLPG